MTALPRHWDEVRPERIGNDLSDEFQVRSEQGASVIVVLNSHAKHFSV